MTGERPPIEAFKCYIERALEYSGGTHTFDDIRDAVAADKLRYWPGVDSVIITEILTTPRKKILNVFLAGGNLAELEAMTAGLQTWARDTQGCTLAQLTGRRGWARTYLTRTGWAETSVVFEKEL